MKTTLEIDENVMRELKAKAAREGRTMSELVEGALRRELRDEAKPKPGELPPLPSFDGGGWTFDVDSREALYDMFDEENPLMLELKQQRPRRKRARR